MGWDSTMSSEYKNNDRIFDIEICGNHYKTSSSNIVFQHDDDDMCSAATRIYKAYRVDDIEEKEELIIKDYWPTELLDTEDIILKKMLDDITDPLERELVERSILTPISCERVKLGNREDHTKETILRGESPNMSYKIILPGERGETGTFILRGPNSFIDLVPTPSTDDSTNSLPSDDITDPSSSNDSAKVPSSDDRTKLKSPPPGDRTEPKLPPSDGSTKLPPSDKIAKSPCLDDNMESLSLNSGSDMPFLDKSIESLSSDDLVVREVLPFDDTANRKSYVHRWHYRIVYKQLAIPYKNLRNLKDMSLLLEQTVQGESLFQTNGQILILNYFIALQVIHKAGWVHRDLSIGNLYLYIDPVSGVKRGLIGDFEFAKKVGSGGRHDKRIVTLFQIIPNYY